MTNERALRRMTDDPADASMTALAAHDKWKVTAPDGAQIKSSVICHLSFVIECSE
jgi:hypothetical protein